VFAVAGDEPWVRWDWVGRHIGEIAGDLGQHIELTVITIVVGLALSLPLALAARRWQATRGPILSVGGVLYTIPSLALFAFVVPWTGLSLLTSEIGLVGYTLVILVRNILISLDAVPADVREAAQGMGYRRRRQLLDVELPLALPGIIAGIRIATVSTIALVTVTALIGQGGLGQLILDGLLRDFRTPLVIGAVLSVTLAVVADLSLAGLQRLVTPWARRSG